MFKNRRLTFSTKRNTYINFHEFLDKVDIPNLEDSIKAISSGIAIVTPEQLSKLLADLDMDGHMPIHKAMKCHSNRVIKMFLQFYRDNKFDINVADQWNYTPLHCICMNDAAEIDRLKEMFADFPDLKVDCGNKDQNTPLHFLCKYITSPQCTEIAELMIRKAGKRIVNHQNSQGETPLHKAVFNPSVRILMVDFLIHNGADLNVRNEKGETALHYAVHLQRKDLISALLMAGADPSAKGSDGKTPLDHAIDRNYKSIITHLKNIISLKEWAEKETIEQEYVQIFMREEMYLDVLKDVDENLLDNIGIKKKGPKVKILNACKRIAAPPKSPSATHNPIFSDDSFDTFNIGNIDKPLEQRELVLQVLKIYLFIYPKKRKHDGAKTNSILDLLIAKDELEFTKKLGEGKSGRVFKGIYRSHLVAIKVLKSSADVSEFEKEFLIMSSITSPFIIKFYGACLKPQLAMVMEICAKGSLYDCMQDNTFYFDWKLFFKFALDMTKGLHTLHNWSPPVVHRDFKSPNLLVDENNNIKLSDFGLSRFATDTSGETLMKVCGTVAYAAPEIFYGGAKYKPKCDIYGMAVVLWEMVLRIMKGQYSRPYSEYQNLKFDFQIITLVCEEKLRPTFPEKCPPGIASIIRQAWDPSQEARPSAGQILDMLEQQKEIYEKNIEEWDLVVIGNLSYGTLRGAFSLPNSQPNSQPNSK